MEKHRSMPEGAARRVARTAGLAITATLVGAGLGARSRTLVAQLGTLPVDQLVELVVVTVGALVAWWFALSSSVAAACVLARLAGPGWSTGELLVARLAPTLVRRAVALTVAAGIGLGAATGAGAATGDPAPTVGASQVAATDDLGWPLSSPSAVPQPEETSAPTADETVPGPAPTPLPPPPSAKPTPTSPVATAVPPPPEGPAPHAAPGTGTNSAHAGIGEPVLDPPAPGSVVVRTGDSLWAIARRALPAGASDAQVQTAWPAWYQVNRSTIGPDPDLIRPGQVLVDPQVSA